MPADRSNLKRRCAIKRDARLQRATLRKAILERAQGVAPKMTELNAVFSMVPPPHHRGAPIGNRNARKHGARSRERRALFAELKAHIAEGRALLVAFKENAVIPGEHRAPERAV